MKNKNKVSEKEESLKSFYVILSLVIVSIVIVVSLVLVYVSPSKEEMQKACNYCYEGKVIDYTHDYLLKITQIECDRHIIITIYWKEDCPKNKWGKTIKKNCEDLVRCGNMFG